VLAGLQHHDVDVGNAQRPGKVRGQALALQQALKGIAHAQQRWH